MLPNGTFPYIKIEDGESNWRAGSVADEEGSTTVRESIERSESKFVCFSLDLYISFILEWHIG